MGSAARGQPEGERLPRARRITRSQEIRALFRRGKRSRTAHLDVIDSTSPVSHARVGVVVPRYGHSIVERNKVKRRIREILRRRVLPRLTASRRAVDVLVRARREAYGASYAELETELVEWAERRWRSASSSR